MSLNGLDNPTVVEAYQTALSEAGGWFLLRYTSRDEVALLDRGTGGVPDVRNAIEGYEESSPLYGFLQYRRRKVVLSYLPEDLSRLVRARTTVQFQSILDKFSPHDTVFSLARPSDLTESALSSACLLHTASGSITPSSSSLRRRRLMEIAEDAEETPASKDAVPTQTPTQDIRQRSISQLSEATFVPPPSLISDVPEPSHGDLPPPTSPETAHTNSHAPSIPGDIASERPDSSRNFGDESSYAPSEPRKSTQSARPSLRDLEHAAGSKPKVKLGPRPSVDGSGRPRTAGNISRNAEQRPVASLPAGVRSSSFRKSNPGPTRPRSQGNPVTNPSSRSVPPVPPLLVPPLSMPIARPQLSPGAKSLSALSSSGTSHEKERLMKALQMRKSQMQKRAQEEKPQTSHDPNDDKENIGQIGEMVKPRSERLSSISEYSKGPLSETQSLASSESLPVLEPVEMEIASVEPAVDTAMPHQNGEIPTKSMAPSSMVPEPSVEDKKLEKVPITETLPEPETGPVQDGMVVSVGGKMKCGTGSPSAVLDVPLDDNRNPLTPPEEEIVVTPPQVENSLVPEETKILEAPAEPTEAIDPQSIPSPKSSASGPNSITDPIAIPVSHAGQAPTPEILSVEQVSATTRRDKRKPALEPIQVPTPEYSDDDNLLSDDSFMEELKSATVEEAKPISVGKSPLSPGYSNTSGYAYIIRRQIRFEPVYSNNRTPTGPVLVAKKINVSSGISKRIKALEKFSNSRDASPTPPQTVATPSASSFETLRKRASISLGAGNAEVPSLSRHPSYAPEPFSRASSLKRPDSQPGTSAARATNAVSVTARIVRDQNANRGDSNTDSTESRMLNLQASPLTVEHGPSDVPQSLPAESTPNKSEKRSMSTSSAGSIPPLPAMIPRSESGLSVSSASRNDGIAFPRSPSEVSASSPEEKKESRASRILRRMSSITSSSRKGTASSRSPAVKEEENLPSVDESKNTAELPEAVDIGEVNVQFPDTLLWKRRFIRIDNRGYLVLTPGNIDSSNRNMIKRYHLTEFRTPCLPDEERQELPNSILLDFLDGSTLQCACESRQGQAFVLQTLVHAYGIHQQLLS
ncbi:hypothetical protein ARAM_001356 [Aspergillus rambellii]|uniref:GPI-anchored cell surface glycoprotein n=1 Tax=Aspergillus rambellii TaxID=308745 RepID=A0A0F8UDV3_9EURO|nr:hypothetical protein ARAM_001356 [Aspergillus rambellii]